MSGEKRGQYMELWWECEPTFELVRGHVPEDEARQALEHYWEVSWQERDRSLDEYGSSVHLYARYAQTSHSREYDLSSTIMLYRKPGAGRFKVTVFPSKLQTIEGLLRA